MRINPLLTFITIFLFLPLSSFAGELVGGPYSIKPLTINGGGTTSTGGPYEISASTAQPGGVGTIAEGPYTFEDGFWAMVLATTIPMGPIVNFDIRPVPLDGFIDARDLIGWFERVSSGQDEAQILIDFAQYWQDTFPPTKK